MRALKLFFFTLVTWPFVGLAEINPFLRPGSSTPLVKPTPPPPPPKPQPNPLAQQDVEFRGYITLNESNLFCVFNKKSNRGEWVRLNEKTFEEFEITAFNAESEILELSYMSQQIKLSLIKPSTSPALQNPPPALPSVDLPVSQTGSPRTMPPRPKVPPPMPAWLVERQKARATNPYAQPGRTNASTSRLGRSLPLTPYPGQSRSVNSSNNPNLSEVKSVPSPSSLPVSTSPGASQASSFAPQGRFNVQVNSIGGPNALPLDPTTSQTNQSEEILLDELPPPPPPPNILPPSPPPDIIPTRE